MPERLYRLVYDHGGGFTEWEKTAAELLVPNGDEPLIAWMLRQCDERGATAFHLELVSGSRVQREVSVVAAEIVDSLPKMLAEQLLIKARDTAREHIKTEPDHALYPNHRADEWLRDKVEEVLHA